MTEPTVEEPSLSVMDMKYDYDRNYQPVHPAPVPVPSLPKPVHLPFTLVSNGANDVTAPQPDMDDPPPAYQEVESKDAAFQFPPITFCDIYPKCITPGHEARHPVFERFDAIIQAANSWLKENPLLKLVSCETLDRRCSLSGDVDTQTPYRHEPSNGEQSFVRILRLWLTKETAENANLQQLGYCNLVPTTRTAEEKAEVDNTLPDTVVFHPGMLKVGHVVLGGIHGMTVGMKGPVMKFQRYQTIQQVLKAFNRQIVKDPLPGRVLSVESVEFKKSESWEREAVDLDCCYWHMRNMTAKHFLSCLRVYYILGESASEQISVTSFSPAKQSRQGGHPSGGRFEGFDSMLTRTSQWIQSHSGQKLLNLQSTLIRFSGSATIGALKDDIDTEATYTMELSTGETNFIRILRAFSVKTEKHGDVDKVTCKLFHPIKIDRKKYETVQEVLQRTNRWILAAGLQDRFVGFETTELPLSSLEATAATLKTNATAMKMYRTRGNFWITCFRLYIRGEYTEPADDETSVQVKNSSCTIS
ncbi:uncharacterized protein LOC135488938 [Lineus longissimus]|uniref:uncharacterized protein LOC135488938 n=1 Tax=Lineus longissimus TaxID=88925 RepID=UPI002B4CD47A